MAKGFKTGGKNFQKGVVTNPNGRPPLPPEIKEARKLTQLKFIELVNKYLYSSKEELNLIAQDPKTAMIDLIVIKVVQNANAKGDQIRLSFLLDRLIGKVPTPIDMSIDPNLVSKIKEYESKSTEELLEIVSKMIQDK